LIPRVAWVFVAILFGLYFTLRIPVPSFDSHKDPGKIITDGIKNQLAGLAVQEKNEKEDFLNPDSLPSAPDAVFCMTLSDIYSLKMYLNEDDKIATAKLFDRGACAIIKPCLNLHVMEERGDIVHVRREGITQTLWTFRGSFEVSQK
jgi:hypothetical protein